MSSHDDPTAHASLESRARANVVARNAYKAVMAVWLAVAAGLVLLWLLTTPGGYFWPAWPMLGMGIAAVTWGLNVYGRSPFRVRREQIEREMQRLRTEEGEGR